MRKIDKQVGSQEYLPPRTEILSFTPGGIVCGSPLPGGNEDIGYETWQ